ncbi:hypothetical protein ACU4GD_33840 [Cupriavidus basilensis]
MLEPGFAPDNGARSNQNGAAPVRGGVRRWVGRLSGGCGPGGVPGGSTPCCSSGRCWSPTCRGPAPTGFRHPLDSYLPSARADNAVSYKGTFGGLTVERHLQPGPRHRRHAGTGPTSPHQRGQNCPADHHAPVGRWIRAAQVRHGDVGPPVAYDFRWAVHPGAAGG